MECLARPRQAPHSLRAGKSARDDVRRGRKERRLRHADAQHQRPVAHVGGELGGVNRFHARRLTAWKERVGRGEMAGRGWRLYLGIVMLTLFQHTWTALYPYAAPPDQAGPGP